MSATWLQKASEHLEWPRLAAAVLARCRGPSARQRGLTLAADRAQAERKLERTREVGALLAAERALPLDGLADLEPHLLRLERKGALKAGALAEIETALANGRALRALLAGERERLPALFESCATDPALDALEEVLRAALERDGTLSDRASPELRALRVEIANLRERIVGRLQQLIERHEDVLSDRYFTVRDGRYVLPVRRDAHERVHGIVHGTSQSGASVFVEPRAVVAHGNRLKLAESELEREEERVLAALSERASEQLPSLHALAAALDCLDLHHACAVLGRDLGGSVPELAQSAEVKLAAARHPLLVLDGIATVPNDLEIQPGQGLIVSGPNASGKTVLLKTLGLAALMARHGLPIAAAEGSRIAFFERVLTDVGDEQSTANNLSTFSAHVTNLRSILELADREALVLLDELATGTDPDEGAALACAIVDAIASRGAALAVTTHYEALKAMSLRDPRLRSASVGFDVERMEPTFELTLDVPGVSSALLVAKRFGIPDAVLAFAEQALPRQVSEFEQLVSELRTRTLAAGEERARIEHERKQVAALRSEHEQRLARLRREGDAQIAREVGELQREVRTARAELEHARARLKAEPPSPRALGELQKSVDAVAARVALGGDLAPRARAAGASEARAPLPELEIRVGQRVYVPRLRCEAIVVEAPSKGRVRVAVGPLKLAVDSDELRAPDAAPPSPAPPQPIVLDAPAERGRDNTLNVKGLRVDDALSMVDSFVDRLATTELRVGYVLHGHGTGALRDAVRKHLKTAVPQVRDSGPARGDEGGDAVTVFYLE